MRHYLTITMTILTFICVIVLITIAFDDVEEAIQQERERYEQYIGTTYVLDNDTLTIVDYATFTESYTLSNGTIVSKHLILNNNVESSD